jgi:hypothetical protein
VSRDDRHREREKLSFSERDRRLRDKQKGYNEGPQNPAARERSEAATKKYVKSLDSVFATGKGGAQGEELAKAVRAAHGTPGLARACTTYREAIGLPSDLSLLALFLDSGDSDLVVAALTEMRSLQQAGNLNLGAGQRSQVRTLALAFDDRIAEAAEDLLASLG